VGESVLGQPLNDATDIARIRAAVQFNSMDLLQAAHTFSGIEIALWDVLGKARGEPVWRLLGYKSASPKLAYASQLFGQTPAETEAKAKSAREAGFHAVKFGWVNYGRGSVAEDAAHIEAARAGMGPDSEVLIDAGQIFAQDVEAAAARLPALERFGVLWLEEPFLPDALGAYAALADRGRKVRMAGGEGCHSAPMAAQSDRFRQSAASSRSIPAALAGWGRPRKWRIMRRPRASPSSTTPSPPTSPCRLHCSPMPASPIIGSRNIPSRRAPWAATSRSTTSCRTRMG
jgi:L-alanine-DL-glutamate epimerase-like enolase superfamily enzyme